jgi:hypothetical protein
MRVMWALPSAADHAAYASHPDADTRGALLFPRAPLPHTRRLSGPWTKDLSPFVCASTKRSSLALGRESRRGKSFGVSLSSLLSLFPPLSLPSARRSGEGAERGVGPTEVRERGDDEER